MVNRKIKTGYFNFRVRLLAMWTGALITVIYGIENNTLTLFYQAMIGAAFLHPFIALAVYRISHYSPRTELFNHYTDLLFMGIGLNLIGLSLYPSVVFASLVFGAILASTNLKMIPHFLAASLLGYALAGVFNGFHFTPETGLPIEIVSSVYLVVALVLLGWNLSKRNASYKRIRNELQEKNEELATSEEELKQQNEEIAAQRDQVEHSYLNIQKLSEIGKKITSVLNVKEINKRVYKEVNQLMDAAVFGAAIYDSDAEGLFFTGFIENNETLEDHYDYLSENNRLSVFCFKNQRVVHISNFRKEIGEYLHEESIPKAGEQPASLIYLPLNYNNKKIGVITVQSFREAAFSDYDIFILKNLAVYVAIALENASHFARAEEIAKKLSVQNAELERSNNDMNRLTAIGRQVTSHLELKHILREINDNVHELLDVDAFSIGLFNRNKHTIDYISLIEGDKKYPEFSYSLEDPYSISAYVFREHEEVILNDYKRDFYKYFPDYSGQDFNIKVGDIPGSMMTLPLVTPDKLVGVISVHAKKVNAFSQRDQNILRQIASFFAIAISNAESYRKLDRALKELKSTRDQLILSEKMALIGQLTAGVAHEINTPVGIGVSAASYLKEETEVFDKKMKENKLTKSGLTQFIGEVREASQLIMSNLERAATLVKSFKDVAVDQHNEIGRSFEIKSYVQEILHSLKNEFKRAAVKVVFSCKEEIHLHSYPGAIAQIITNFSMNSIQHGFEGVENREVTIEIVREIDHVVILYRDNGKGIPEDMHERIFEPFYTTNRHRGGSGLGLHIVYNLVTQRLNGKITIASKLNLGAQFKVVFPILILSNEPA